MGRVMMVLTGNRGVGRWKGEMFRYKERLMEEILDVLQ
jgi:hypothetical protein